MKKIFMALCAMAMVAFVACKKDPVTPTPDNNDPAEQHDTREGAYDPVCKITGIVYSDDTAPETWLWDPETGHLISVNDDDYCGGYVERISFTYRNDGRVDQVQISNIETGGLLPIGNLSGTMAVGYNGEYISSLSVVNGDAEVLTVNVQHGSDKKVSGATLDLADNVLLDLFNTMLAQFLADSTGQGDLATSVDNVTGSVSFSWEGSNVRQALLTLGFRVASTVGTLIDVVGEENLTSVFGQYGSYLTMVPATQPLYFNVTVGDTVAYTYDNKTNPYRHFLGRLDVSALTANNVETAIHNGNAHIAIGTTIMGQTMQLYETDYALPVESTFNDYLEYNAAGCPLRMEDADGTVIEFQYME